MATPKTITLPNLTSGGTPSQMAGINQTVANINTMLAGGITGIQGQPNGQTGAVYFTPSGPQNYQGQTVTPPSLGTPVVNANNMGTPAVTIPNASTPKNYAGTMAGAVTGAGINTSMTPEEQRLQEEQQQVDLYKRMVGEPASKEQTYNDLYNQSGVQQNQQEVNNFKAQIGSINAQANADQLALTGQGRGIPETIIGGQQAQISKEATIKLLPLTAQLAVAQDNLALAQQHLDTLYKIRSDDIDNQYNYKVKLYESVRDELSKTEQRKWDVTMLGIKQDAENQSIFEKQRAEALQNATFQKAPASVLKGINSATNAQQLYASAGTYAQSAIDKADLQLKQAQIDNTYSQVNERDGANTDNLDTNITPETKSSGIWGWIKDKLGWATQNQKTIIYQGKKYSVDANGEMTPI